MSTLNVGPLDDVSPDMFPVVNAGRYPLLVVKCDEGMTKKEEEKIAVECQIVDTPDVPENMKVFAHIKLSEPNKIKRLWIACGVYSPGQPIDTQDIVGQKFLGVLGVEDGEGGKRNNLKDWLPITA